MRNSWAEEVMSLIELEPGLLMHSVFDISEIYTGSKVRHFGKIRKKSGVPYEDMIFFDDWDENCKEVGSLGVMCVECPRVRTRGRRLAVRKYIFWRGVRMLNSSECDAFWFSGRGGVMDDG